jgi:hypothetical protein
MQYVITMAISPFVLIKKAPLYGEGFFVVGAIRVSLKGAKTS